MDLVIRPDREKIRNFKQMTFHPSVGATSWQVVAEEQVCVSVAIFTVSVEARLHFPTHARQGPGHSNK